MATSVAIRLFICHQYNRIQMASLKEDILISWRIASHSRLNSVVLWLCAALIVCVLLAYQFSARQPATVALDVGLSVIRLALPLLIILLVQELFSREFERKLYLNSFTYPRSRAYWLLGRVVTIFLICVGMLLIMGLLLAMLTKFSGRGYDTQTPVSLGLPYLVTLGFIIVDITVVIAMSTLLAISASTYSFVLIGTIGFILIARSYTPIIQLLHNNPYTVSTFSDPRLYQDSLSMLSFILPDLGRLDVRMIALYDRMAFMPADWPYLLGATVAYVIALLGLTVWILNKREFN